MNRPHSPQDPRSVRRLALEAALGARILVLDGATGTALQTEDLGPQDFGGPSLEGCLEALVLERPDVVKRLHRRYLDAGADIVETNTFGATPLVLAEYGLEARARELNRRAATLAREACAEVGEDRWVAGAMGPTTKAISVTGGVTFDALVAHFQEQALGLIEGGADYLLLETSQDTLGIKAGLLGIDAACDELDVRVPVAVSGTIEASGTMLAGQDAEALAVSLMHRDLLYLGLNCATGPVFMTDHVRTLAEMTRARVACVPNAGLPDEDGRYADGPDALASVLRRFAEHGWLNLVGGCCGTTPEHIEALQKAMEGCSPRTPTPRGGTWLSGVDALEIEDQVRPAIVGERTNVLGSRRFKHLIRERRFEEAAAIGRAQVKSGAHLIDVCLQDPEADETADMEAFLAELVGKVRVPLVIDSTDALVMERALRFCQGKALLNSVNLEDGLDRFEQVVPLAKRYGAALVVGLIDEDPEQGMAVTVTRKLEIAGRAHGMLTKEFQIPEEDIIWDALVFPCATGDEAYQGSAEQTIAGVRALKDAFPRTKTLLGISNVSFGLPAAAREVLNSVFLFQCTQAGLDLAIVNSERLERYPSIPEAERRLAEDLLFGRGEDPVGAYAAAFRDRKPGRAKTHPTLPLAERLEAYIIEGSKDGLGNDLDLALEAPEYVSPLDIVNGPLMAGMTEVGRLFNDGELIVAEVLQSASAMKTAVSHLEPHMEGAAASTRGTVLLATVKGDVHDIGKNLVDIVLSNNGFQVVNLGIKIPSVRLIEAVRQHEPDVIGLSGLLVKSAHMMVATAEDLREAGIDTPVLVGGAALSETFTYGRIAPAYDGPVLYAKDAMHGLALARRLRDPAERPRLLGEIGALRTKAEATMAAKAQAATPASPPPISTVRQNIERPTAPDTDRVVLEQLDLDEIWGWVNPQMLYGKHLGLRGSVRALDAAGDAKLRMLQDAVAHAKALARDGAMRADAVYRFFPVQKDAETLVVLDPDTGVERERIPFPRQTRGAGLSVLDFVIDRDPPDHVGFFLTSAGRGVREIVGRLREDGHYLESHALGALAVETAEAAAEWLHARMRRLWGFPDEASIPMADRFRGSYRGCRYSFGYPACPDLEDQTKLFRLLEPASIGVSLTDGFMMDPEASVSALVVHHPDARYFAV